MSRPKRILVCDDESAARRGILRALGSSYSFVECESGTECLDRLESLAVDLVLLDMRMPGLDGRATLERIGRLPAPPPVIMVTADSQLRTAIEALRAGAADFLAKPYEIEELRWVVERTLSSAGLERENRQLRDRVRTLGGPDRLLGQSQAMEMLKRDVEKVAPADASVLIRGETGTGKELVARTVHEGSAVSKGPFIAVNCAAIPETLLESELFGHRKGAFTGADRDHVGRFQQADGGTLFLDEIGDMPLAAQAKLLRVLQERQVEPLGGKPVAIDVRVVAATHQDLEQLCQEKQFRQDLYYRLRVVELSVPPLRERGSDISLLAEAFLAASPTGPRQLSPAVTAALAAHPWPGNVRELKNAMDRAAIFCGSDQVELGDLPAELRTSSGNSLPAGASGDHISETSWPPGTGFQEAKVRAVEAFERAFLLEALQRAGGNVSQAARDMGVHRQNLQKKLRQLELDSS